MAPDATVEWLEVELFNDRSKEQTTEVVTPQLASLFCYAHDWATEFRQKDPCTLTFSSMLAAMMASHTDLCRWLQRHLGLRGVAAETMTNGWPFRPKQLPGPLTTSMSFRTAWAAARKLGGTNDPATPIDVRHYMAAYAICPDYHLVDFLRLRIDRRAWCLELAERLREDYPDEDLLWQAYATLAPPIPVLEFNTDAPSGRDLLNMDREVEAFSRLIAARTTNTPLSIGVFGAWGSGKSFFMRRVRDRVASLGEIGEAEGRSSPYQGRIAQIEFNAWHYSEGSLVASLVDHIFRNLRVGIDDEDTTLRRRGAELIVQLDQAKKGLAERERALEEAEARQLDAERKLAQIEGQIPAEILTQERGVADAQQSADDAEADLAKAQEQLSAEIDRAVARAPVRAAAEVLLTGIDDPNVTAADNAIRALVSEARGIGARWLPIGLGLVVLAIGILSSKLVDSDVYPQVISAITALGAIAAAVMVWLRKLNSIASKGEEFQQAQAKLTEDAANAIKTKHQKTLDALQKTAETRRELAKASEDKLAKLRERPGMAKEQLEMLEQEREAATNQRAMARETVGKWKDALTQLGTQTLLGAFLDDRAVTEGYRKNLTIFTQVRNDFERLSHLMSRATEEYYENVDKPPPTVSRIVLYIDDLDRCPEDKVIEVLRTVHLLLAFPLFVCVVAVDPRWVSICLRNAPGLLSHDGWQVGTTLDGARVPAPANSIAQELDKTLGTPATPADYIEKIFQIPLWLRPVPAAQRPAIVRAFFDPPPKRRNARLAAPVVTAIATSTTGSAAAATADDEASIAAMAAAITPDLQKAGAAVNRGAVGATERPADDVTIDPVELDYLGQLGNMLDGNPRALKRFVNTYRLVKSSLSDVELEVFRSELPMLGENPSNARYLPYRVCMAQLAVLCTQRERALRMVRLADENPKTLNAWFDRMTEEDADLAGLFREALPTETIASATSGHSEATREVGFDTFALWLERTRRYSFYL